MEETPHVMNRTWSTLLEKFQTWILQLFQEVVFTKDEVIKEIPLSACSLLSNVCLSWAQVFCDGVHFLTTAPFNHGDLGGLRCFIDEPISKC